MPLAAKCPRGQHPTYPAYPTHHHHQTTLFPSPDRLRRARIIPIFFFPSLSFAPGQKISYQYGRSFDGPQQVPEGEGGSCSRCVAWKSLFSFLSRQTRPIAYYFARSDQSTGLLFYNTTQKHASTALRKLVCPSLPSLLRNEHVAQRGMLPLPVMAT